MLLVTVITLVCSRTQLLFCGREHLIVYIQYIIGTNERLLGPILKFEVESY